ncbi:MAG TPA: fumarylacetoacetase [Acidimicrobiales bacterium]|nr:fumarylacetoacetase [Acidimicrobiales bacterium]
MAESWVDVPEGSGWGLANLPYGVVNRDDPRLVVAIGNHALDLRAAAQAGLLDRTGIAPEVFARPHLNGVLEQTPDRWAALREAVLTILTAPSEPAADLLMARSGIENLLPFAVADYVDFYASEHHATNLGRLFRPNDEPLMPNWRHLPVGYHGRSATVVVSGTPVRRPVGLTKPPDGPVARRPSASLDVEVEFGAVVGFGNRGAPVPAAQAARRIFGFVLLNDWSARDIQAFEYQPLGPHLGKSFATSISPWVIPHEALAPFAVDGPLQEPEPDEFLRQPEPRGLDIQFELVLDTAAMAESGAQPEVVSRPRFRDMYWSPAQMLAHVTSNGATISPGDLYGSGTVSGPDRSQFGSLIELTWRGSDPLRLPTGETRAWLQDGDSATIRGWCESESARIDLGEVTGTITPAPDAHT